MTSKFSAVEAAESPRGAAVWRAVHARWAVGLSFGAVLFALLLPLALVAHPPLVDLPNHLARNYVQTVLAGQTPLSQFYAVEWRAIPYLATDVLYAAMSTVLSPYDVGRVLIGIAFVLWLGAPMLLHRVLWGRFSAWPLVGALAIYNATVAWGFVNYVLSSAIAVYAAILWIVWKTDRMVAKTAAFLILATLVYFCHLLAFALLGLLVLSYEAGPLFARDRDAAAFKRFLLAGISFSAGTLHFLTAVQGSLGGLGGGFSFGGVWDRLDVLFSTVHSAPDFQESGFVEIGIFVLLAGVLYAGLRSGRWFQVHPTMVPVLLMTGLVALATPMEIMGVYQIHYRLPFVVLLLLVGASRCADLPVRARLAIAAGVGALLALKTAGIASDWLRHDAETRELIQALDRIEPGDRLLPVIDETAGTERRHWHSSTLAVIEREAFSPLLFTGPTALRTTLAFRDLVAPAGRPVSPRTLSVAREMERRRLAYPKVPPGWLYWRTWWRDFSHVLVIARRGTPNPYPELLEPVGRGSFFVLYRNRGYTAARTAPDSSPVAPGRS